MTGFLKSLSAVVVVAASTSTFADETKPGGDAAQAAAAPAAEKAVVAPEGAKPAAEAGAAANAEVAKPAEPAKKPVTSAGDEVLRVFPLDKEEWLKDPFLVLDMEMEAVVEDFGDGKAKPPAEATQPRIVSRFDAVIELLEKKCSGNGGGARPNKPAEKSTLAKGPGGMGELKTPKKTGKGYDDLTPKEREKILQSKTEGFPPGFEDVLADYYRRLAKGDNTAAEPAADAVPAAKPETNEQK